MKRLEASQAAVAGAEVPWVELPSWEAGAAEAWEAEQTEQASRQQEREQKNQIQSQIHLHSSSALLRRIPLQILLQQLPLLPQILLQIPQQQEQREPQER